MTAKRTSPPGALDGSSARNPPRFADSRPSPVLPDGFASRLRGVCGTVHADDAARVEAGRDWWPLSALWASNGRSPCLPDLVAVPTSVAEVSAVTSLCNRERVPLTVFAGASGVCGASLPLHAGVSLDMTGLDGISDVDVTSRTVEVRAGTFGRDFEDSLRSAYDLTVGHWPQSMALSTVGGWVACRSAGQFSTRYGKIEDMVTALEVVLADGTVLHVGGTYPRSATGPDLTQLFVGSEGTLGVITSVRLRAHKVPPAKSRFAYAFSDFESGLGACMRILQRGATPAVLRLYDRVESERNFAVAGACVLLVADEGDPVVLDAVTKVVDEECAEASRLGAEPVETWFEHRNEIPDIASLVAGGLVVDTVEVAGSWRALPAIYTEALSALRGLDGTIAASAHQSHSYSDGACLYFTFAGRPGDAGRPGNAGPTGATSISWSPEGAAEGFYKAAFDAVTGAALRNGGTVSHHHGIGLNRAGYMHEHLGAGLDVLRALKTVLDPNGILNPGKLGLPQ